MRTRARNVGVAVGFGRGGHDAALPGDRVISARGPWPRKVGERERQHGALRFEEVGAARGEVVARAGHRGAEAASDAVAVDRRPDPSPDRVRDPRRGR